MRKINDYIELKTSEKETEKVLNEIKPLFAQIF